MGQSKKQLHRNAAKIKARIAELEGLCRFDPLKSKPKIHEELAELKKKLAEE